MRPSDLPLLVVRMPLVLAGEIAKRASGAAVGAVHTVQGVVGRREAREPEPIVAEPEPIVVPEPELSIAPPWPGYDGMTAAEIRVRMAAQGSETAATVSLYEASRKGRRSVLEAAAAGMRG